MENSKSTLRKKILDLRSSIARSEIEKMSYIIMEKAAELFMPDNYKLIMCYMDFRNEVITGDLIRKFINLGKKVALPLVEESDSGRRDISAYEIKDVQSDVFPGTYGILEPNPDVAKLVDPYDIDAVIVPGVVFDEGKYRVGYGAGYYDRFLTKVRPDCIKAAPAFELQIVDKVSREIHDVPMNIIITEKRII